MKFAIRDDDTSYFTKPEELEAAYDFVKEGVISLSVVPMSVTNHRGNIFPYGKDLLQKEGNISKNESLVRYLYKNSKYDLLLHGYSHEYKKCQNKWKAEMIWKKRSQIKDELAEGKKLLEKLFDREIDVFVAPNNSINRNAIDVIEELNMNYSGIIYFADRKITLAYLKNFFTRWLFRIKKGIPYPGILDYGKHKELVAYSLDSFERLVYEYNECKAKGHPFVVYTHYWKVNSDQGTKDLLRKIYEYVIADGASLVGVTECFEET